MARRVDISRDTHATLEACTSAFADAGVMSSLAAG
jgi:hypothetical protein